MTHPPSLPTDDPPGSGPPNMLAASQDVKEHPLGVPYHVTPHIVLPTLTLHSYKRPFFLEGFERRNRIARSPAIR